MSEYLDSRMRGRRPITDWEDGFVVCDAIAAGQIEPTWIIPTGDANQLLTHIAYDGTVTQATVRLWYRAAEVWYRAITSDSGIPLTGENEARLWEVSRNARCGFTVDSVAGGTVTVRVEAVR